jgi:Arylsulfotransferase (ASST)
VPTRRDFLALSASATAGLLLPRGVLAAATESSALVGVAHFYSRPDLTPPTIAVSTAATSTAPGYVFVAPFKGPGQPGPMIVDNAGEPVWIHASKRTIMNFRVQSYRGRDVLTWWEGQVVDGFWAGELVIVDSSYRELARFSAGNGYQAEVHEFLVTARGTALVTINNIFAEDLTPWGGPADGRIVEGVVQEIDIASGKVLLEWHSLDHVAPEESYIGPSSVWDYLHVNSIEVDEGGQLLVSARHTSTVYKVDRSSGAVLWRLGGKKSDFAIGDGAAFAFQHDARGHPGGLVSIFDNAAYSQQSATEPRSRGIVLELDTAAMTAQLVRQLPNPHGQLAVAMGNVQELANGGLFVGWGTVPEFSEFSADGELLFDAEFVGAGFSYRAFRHPWTAKPTGRPNIGVSQNADGTLDVFGSWNGSTAVTHWRVAGGPTRHTLRTLRTVPRTGFETATRLARPPAFVAVAALDAAGRVLGTSRAYQVPV